jgi:hypothetical protein
MAEASTSDRDARSTVGADGSPSWVLMMRSLGCQG